MICKSFVNMEIPFSPISNIVEYYTGNHDNYSHGEITKKKIRIYTGNDMDTPLFQIFADSPNKLFKNIELFSIVSNNQFKFHL